MRSVRVLINAYWPLPRTQTYYAKPLKESCLDHALSQILDLFYSNCVKNSNYFPSHLDMFGFNEKLSGTWLSVYIYQTRPSSEGDKSGSGSELNQEAPFRLPYSFVFLQINVDSSLGLQTSLFVHLPASIIFELHCNSQWIRIPLESFTLVERNLDWQSYQSIFSS